MCKIRGNFQKKQNVVFVALRRFLLQRRRSIIWKSNLGDGFKARKLFLLQILGKIMILVMATIGAAAAVAGSMADDKNMKTGVTAVVP